MGITATSARRAAGAAVLLLAGAGTAGAQTVVAFDGAVVQSCVLSITTPGVLGGNTNGTEIGSEQTGGTAAVLAITATAGAPTIAFAAPTMSLKPVTYTGTAAVTIATPCRGAPTRATPAGHRNIPAPTRSATPSRCTPRRPMRRGSSPAATESRRR
ncbi:MAG: hypothetical protein M3438_07020 [Pseudomonadota bacterium]|nr:hypothetical protein [Sphingomonas sp.]MDQ3478892.1 hypothetical protein [Pseudomonadota bacterium]